MPKGPALIDLKPRLSSSDESTCLNINARERYDSLAARIFDEEERDLEVFKRKLFSAIKERNAKKLKELIRKWKSGKKDVSLNFKDITTGNTPMILAAVSNNKEIVELLIDENVDVTLTNNDSKTALEVASKNLQSFIISATTSNDLQHAAWQGNVPAVKDILKHDVDLNKRNDEGMTPLLLATRDINFFEKLKYIDYRPLQVVKLLLEQNADATVSDHVGRTALHHLVRNIGLTSKEVANILFARSPVKIDRRDKHQVSPLHTACKLGDASMVEMFLNKGANIAAVDCNGKTPLHYAVEYDNLKAVDVLMKQGADAKFVDDSGQSAIDIAKKAKNRNLVKVLKGQIGGETNRESKISNEFKRTSSKVLFDGFDDNIGVIQDGNQNGRNLKQKSNHRNNNRHDRSSRTSPMPQSPSTDGFKLPALQSQRSQQSPQSPTKSIKSMEEEITLLESIKTPIVITEHENAGPTDKAKETRPNSNTENYLLSKNTEDLWVNERSETKNILRLPLLDDGAQQQLRQQREHLSIGLPRLPATRLQIGGSNLKVEEQLSMIEEEWNPTLKTFSSCKISGIEARCLELIQTSSQAIEVGESTSYSNDDFPSPVREQNRSKEEDMRPTEGLFGDSNCLTEDDEFIRGDVTCMPELLTNQLQANKIQGEQKAHSNIYSELKASNELLLDLIDDYKQIEVGTSVNENLLVNEEKMARFVLAKQKSQKQHSVEKSEVSQLESDVNKFSRTKKIFSGKNNQNGIKSKIFSVLSNDRQLMQKKALINRRNEEFTEKIIKGKAGDNVITELVKIPACSVSNFPSNSNLAVNRSKVAKSGTNCTNRTAISAAPKEYEILKKNLGPVTRTGKRDLLSGNAKAGTKFKRESCKKELKKIRKPSPKKNRLHHLSLLPGFKNCSNDDDFIDMVLGQSIEKFPKSLANGVNQNLSRIAANENVESKYVLPVNRSPSRDSQALPGNHESIDNWNQEIDEKYKSILDFYITSSKTEESEVLIGVNSNSLNSPRKSLKEEFREQYVAGDSPQISVKEGDKLSHRNESMHSEEEILKSSGNKDGNEVCLPQQNVDNRNLPHDRQEETGNPKLTIQRTHETECFPVDSPDISAENIFKHMTKIAFAPALFSYGSESSYRGTGFRNSEELSPHEIAIFNRNCRVNSIKRSSISTQTSSDDSECGDDDLQDWVKGNVLGKGAHGTVYLGLTSRGHMVAVKQVDLSCSNAKEAEKQYKKLQEEIQLLKCLNHKHIVKFIGTSMENNTVNIFMEYIPGGSLALNIKRFGALKEKVVKRYTRQILVGVAYLHRNGIVHRDIKGANIMLCSRGFIKLIDFGCAKRLNLSLTQTSQLLDSFKGTSFWMSPEVIRGTGHSYKSDIWSIGCTVYEMATGKPPWYGNEYAAMYAIADYSAEIPDLPENFTNEGKDFVRWCLTRCPQERPSAEQLQEHRFIFKATELNNNAAKQCLRSSSFNNR